MFAPVSISQAEPILPQLAAAGLECDQRLHGAIEHLPKVSNVGDHHLFVNLLRMNTVAARFFDLERLSIAARSILAARPNAAVATPSWQFVHLLQRAIRRRTDADILGTRDILRAWLKATASINSRPWTIDLLCLALAGDPSAPLSAVPAATRLLRHLDSMEESTEDFAYCISVSGDRLTFRVASTLDDYLHDSGREPAPQRAMLTHLREQFGVFTAGEIYELEDLINSPRTLERDLQIFFDRHPHFLRRGDYREVFSQTYLSREDRGPLIPDFILTDRALQTAAIIELKLPMPSVVRRQENRDRFSASVMEARAQLLTYRDWFRDRSNRRKLAAMVGMEIFEPRLAVVIGRSTDFLDEFDRQRLAADTTDVEVVTYDDILMYAKRRMTFLDEDFAPPVPSSA
jgi:hypothetical protein